MGKLIFDEDAFYAANKDLSPTAFRIWCDLSNNKAYDSNRISKTYGIDKRTCQRGMKELRDKRYIVNEQFYMVRQPEEESEAMKELFAIYDSFKNKNNSSK